MKKLLVLIALALGFATFGVVQLSAHAADDARDCSTNSIIQCGAMSTAEFTQKYNQNPNGDLQQIYEHYGINPAAINSAKEGVAQSNGQIIVDGRVVATGARSMGRHSLRPGAENTVVINGKTYYERAQLTVTLQVWAFFDNSGKFIGAIAKSCGNPIWGVPTPVPAIACQALQVAEINRTDRRFTVTTTQPQGGAAATGYSFDFGDGTSSDTTATSVTHSYTKAGTYTATVTVHSTIGDKTGPACQAQVTVEEQPVATCKDLTATLSDRTHYTLTASASVTNATVDKYHFVITDQSGKSVLDQETTSATLTGELQPGTYTAKVTAETSLGDRTGDNCAASFTIEQPPCTVPGKEEYPAGSPQCVETPPTLPQTGAGSGLGSILGLGSLVTAISYYVISRRNLLDAFLNR